MDHENKRAQIESINDEVRELHPLLSNVLPRMPGVKRVEKTHGQFERGADFIVELEDQATKRRRYVGIVVKVGKVDGKKATDVEEQVRECAEERLYKVLERVRCSEVWIFTSGGFTERAKEKLSARFVGQTVECFGPDDIARFVDEHYPFFWEKLPHNLGIYYQALGQRLNLLDKATTLVVASQADAPYIDLDIYERVRKSYLNQQKVKPEIKQVDFSTAVLEAKVSLLEAEMGFGKSRLVRRLSNHLASAEALGRTKTVPVFGGFKQVYTEHHLDLDKFIRTQLAGAAAALDDKDLQILVILDGLDECGNGVSCVELFERLVSQARALPNIKVLVTSRPIKSLEEKAALYDEARTFGIRPLSLLKIVRYLESVCAKSNLPKRLFEDLKRSALFKQLPHSPIAAALFSNLLSRSQHDVPQSLTELYSKSMDLMLGRWDQNKHLATEKQFATAELVAEQLAAFFVENQLVFCSRADAEQLIKDYLAKRRTGVAFDEVKDLLFERSTIFAHDLEGNTLSFRHRSFGEFLCAKKMERDRSLDVKTAALSPYWTNVFFFYSGLRRDCPEVLAELQRLVPQDEGEAWMKALAVPSYLLAAFATEFAAVEANVQAVLVDVARLYLEVKSGRTKTRLGELSEMHLLHLFKTIVVEHFSYDFFRTAFETVTLAIDESLEDSEVKAYAQFFLGCAALDQGDAAVFRFLTQTVGTGKLPAPISLAILAELEGGSAVGTSALLKYHKERLHKNFFASRKPNKSEIAGVQARLEVLYKKPVSAKRKGEKPRLGHSQEFDSVLQ